MQKTTSEKALEGLHDYAIYLREKGEIVDEEDEPQEVITRVVTKREENDESAAMTWENCKLRKWREAGRLMDDGTLRVDAGPEPPWTLRKICKVFPQLSLLDRWAVLIACDGQIRRNEMALGTNQNIREVIEELVDIRVRKVIRLEVAQIFQDVLEHVREDRPIKESDLSPLAVNKKKQIHRVRHPETGKLVSKEERDAYEQIRTTALIEGERPSL